MPTLSLAINSRQAQAAVLNLDLAIRGFNTTVNRTTINMRGFDQSIDRSSTFIAAFTKRFLAYQAAFAVLKGIKSSIDTLREFDEMLVRLRGHLIDPRQTVDAQVKSFKALSASIRELANTSRFTPIQVTEGLTTLIKAGLGAADAMAAIRPALSFASVGMLSMDQSVKVLTRSLAQFNLPFTTENFQHFGDVITLAANLSQTEITEMATAFQKAAPFFSEFGSSIEDVSALLMELANAGRVAEVAGTTLRSILTTLVKPTIEQQRALEAMMIGADQLHPSLNTIVEILERLNQAQIDAGKAPLLFERRNIVDVLTLLRGEDRIKGNIALLKNAKGVMKEFSDSLDNTVNAKLNKLSGTFQQLTIDVGDTGLLGAIKDLLTALNDFARSASGYGADKPGVAGFLGNIVQVSIDDTEKASAAWIRLNADMEARWVGIKGLAQRMFDDKRHKELFEATEKEQIAILDRAEKLIKETRDLKKLYGRVIDRPIEHSEFEFVGPPLPEDQIGPTLEQQGKKSGIFRLPSRERERAEGSIRETIERYEAQIALINESNDVRGLELDALELVQAARRHGVEGMDEEIKKAIDLAKKISELNATRDIKDTTRDLQFELSIISLTSDEIEKQKAVYEVIKNLSDDTIFNLSGHLKNLKDTMDAINKATLSKNIKDRTRDLQHELDTLSMTNDERERANVLHEITKDLSPELRAGIQYQIDGYDRLLKVLQLYTRVREVANSMGDAFGNAIEKVIFQTDKLRNILKSLVQEINQAIIRAALIRPVSEGVAGFITGASKALGVGGAGAGAGPEPVTPYSRYQHGTVITEPTFLRSTSGRRGVMSEAGTEGILPLGRDSSGRLGVRSVGGSGGTGGGSSVVVNQYIRTPDANSFRKSRRQIKNDVLKAANRR